MTRDSAKDAEDAFQERLAEKRSDLQAAIEANRAPADIMRDYEARRLLREVPDDAQEN